MVKNLCLAQRSGFPRPPHTPASPFPDAVPAVAVICTSDAVSLMVTCLEITAYSPQRSPSTLSLLVVSPDPTQQGNLYSLHLWKEELAGEEDKGDEEEFGEEEGHGG